MRILYVFQRYRQESDKNIGSMMCAPNLQFVSIFINKNEDFIRFWTISQRPNRRMVNHASTHAFIDASILCVDACVHWFLGTEMIWNRVDAWSSKIIWIESIYSHGNSLNRIDAWSSMRRRMRSSMRRFHASTHASASIRALVIPLNNLNWYVLHRSAPGARFQYMKRDW